MLNLWKLLWNDESGQDLAEYALLLALIAIICIVAITTLGQNIATTFQNIAGHFPVGGGS